MPSTQNGLTWPTKTVFCLEFWGKGWWTHCEKIIFDIKEIHHSFDRKVIRHFTLGFLFFRVMFPGNPYESPVIFLMKTCYRLWLLRSLIVEFSHSDRFLPKLVGPCKCVIPPKCLKHAEGQIYSKLPRMIGTRFFFSIHPTGGRKNQQFLGFRRGIIKNLAWILSLGLVTKQTKCFAWFLSWCLVEWHHPTCTKN